MNPNFQTPSFSMDHSYWLSSSNAIIGSEGQVVQNVSKTKDSNVGTLTQPTMASFANIFAGASAAIASSSNLVDVNTNMLVRWFCIFCN